MAEQHRILLVVTSNAKLANVRDTGYYISEAAEPWQVFRQAGYRVDIASIRGGRPPEDGRDKSDPVQNEFLNDPHIAAQLADTPAVGDVDPGHYDAVYFVGGHGTMWDFPGNEDVARLARGIFEDGGVVAAVCHGPSALVDIALSDGVGLVDGKRVACFTNEEEAAVGLTHVVPFLLADALADKGATVVPAPAFTPNVVSDQRVVTGQNPQSAAGVARGVVEVLRSSRR